MEMHYNDEFTAAFDYASGATTERFQNPLWPLTELFFGSRLRRSLAVVKAFGREIVAKAVAGRREGAADGSLDQISGSLIQSLLDSIDDEQLVADAALNYLSAGMLAGPFASGTDEHCRCRLLTSGKAATPTTKRSRGHSTYS